MSCYLLVSEGWSEKSGHVARMSLVWRVRRSWTILSCSGVWHLSGQTKIKHDAMKTRWTSVVSYFANRVVAPVLVWVLNGQAQCLLPPKIEPPFPGSVGGSEKPVNSIHPIISSQQSLLKRRWYPLTVAQLERRESKIRNVDREDENRTILADIFWNVTPCSLV